MIFKRIASVFFALAFICAIPVFTTLFREYVSPSSAQIGILIFGAIAFLMNLLAFRSEDSANSSYNLTFWIGGIVLFFGMYLKIQDNSYALIPIMIGIVIVGFSYFANPFAKKESKNDDLLDD